MAAGEVVHVRQGKVPADYHCRCKYCRDFIGELIQPDGSYYNRLERRKYYAPIEKGKGGHIAKTPLHIARWAIQQYTKEGDWVIDPTIGAGTTAVEAVTQGRNAAGMEIEFGDVVAANVRAGLEERTRLVNGAELMRVKPQVKFGRGDARNIGQFLDKAGVPEAALIVNNPPYSGDVSMPSPKGKLRGKEHRHLETKFEYDRDLPNLAFLREGQEYWDEMNKIYRTCIDRLVPGGHLVIGVKDMMRNREPFLLHQMFADQLTDVLGMEFVGTALLKHYPTTLFLNTYEKFYGVKPPFYQTITVFQKPGGRSGRSQAPRTTRVQVHDVPPPARTPPRTPPRDAAQKKPETKRSIRKK